MRGAKSGSLLGCTEIHFGRHARALGRSEVVVVPLESCPTGIDAVGELADVSVVILNGLVIPAAFDGDAILASGQFVLKGCEVLIGLEIGVVLNHEQQSADGAIQLPIGGNLVSGGLGVQ